MKNTFNIKTLKAMITGAALAVSTAAFSQTVDVTSSNGYVVHVTVIPVAVNPVGSSCAFGYSYAIGYTYNVSFTGSSAPSALFTLQGNLKCGTSSLFFSLPLSGGIGSGTSAQSATTLTNCATATPASLSCMSSYDLTIQGPGLPSRTLTVSLSAALPIHLNSFDARRQQDGVRLLWTSGSEDAGTLYDLQRSNDGIRWTSLGNVKGKNEAGADYYYTDAHPAPGMNYYRLAETDHGTTAYSKVIGMQMFSMSDISLYPNPADNASVKVKGLEAATGWVAGIRNASGVLIAEMTVADNTITLPEGTPAGLYFVKLENKTTGAAATLKLVKR